MIPAAASLWSLRVRTSADFRADLGQRVRAMTQTVLSRLRRVGTERWWLVLFAGLFLAFFIALLFQPAIGRGGR